MLEARTTHGVVVLLNLHEDVVLLNLHATALAAGLVASGRYINFFLVAGRTPQDCRTSAINGCGSENTRLLNGMVEINMN